MARILNLEVSTILYMGTSQLQSGSSLLSFSLQISVLCVVVSCIRSWIE
jgi:hypothetical protein